MTHVMGRVALGHLTFALACLGFVSLGLPDGLLGVAWPAMSRSFDHDLSALGQLFVVTTAGYFLASMSAARLLAAIGIGALLTASCVATAISLIGYALAPNWPALLACGVIAGAGGGAIDAGLNTHAAHHFSVRAVNVLHGFYGVGTAIGPMIMTSLLVAGAPWMAGYVVVAIAQVLLAIAFYNARGRWSMPSASPVSAHPVAMTATLRVPQVWWCLLVFFLYVGAEAGAGAWIFSVLHLSRDFPLATAGALVTVYWSGLFLGRLLCAFAASNGGADRLLGGCAGVSLGAAALFVFADGVVTASAAVLLLGVASGPLFPTLIASTPARLGAAHTANAVSMQVAVSALGLACVPAVLGIVATSMGLFWVPVILLGLWVLIAGVLIRLTATAAVR